MSAKRALGAFLLCICSVVVVADEELPEIEFLEYLGLWEESDEDWVMFSDPIKAENKDQARSEPAPEGEESMEKPDES
ncbi:MAG: hypothetical protein ACR2QS_16180 [Woeseiaceae bacterium]